jgi:hypothetical protein
MYKRKFCDSGQEIFKKSKFNNMHEKMYSETEVQKIINTERNKLREYYITILQQKVIEFQQILDEMYYSENNHSSTCNYIS